jgi:REP element-mobilizing transposase RayT
MDFPDIHSRRTIRYAGFDYAQPGAYFVTFCAAKGREVFGRIQDQTMVLNPLGQIAQDCWSAIPEHHPYVELDEFVIMPNHGHGVVVIVERSDAGTASKSRMFGESIKGSLSTIVATYKAAVTRTARRQGLLPADASLWHGRFWDHIVRDEADFARIRDYIRNNPARWVEDQLHPQAPPNRFNRWG